MKDNVAKRGLLLGKGLRENLSVPKLRYHGRLQSSDLDKIHVSLTNPPLYLHESLGVGRKVIQHTILVTPFFLWISVCLSYYPFLML